jgi:hypothetical protein
VARSVRKKLKIISGQTTGADTLRHNHWSPRYSLLLLCYCSALGRHPPAPHPPLMCCSTRPAPRTLTDSHTSRSSSLRGTPENVGSQGLRQVSGSIYWQSVRRDERCKGRNTTSRNTVAAEDEVHVALRLGPGPTLVSLLRFYYSEKLYERYIRFQKMCILRISEFGFLEF